MYMIVENKIKMQQNTEGLTLKSNRTMVLQLMQYHGQNEYKCKKNLETTVTCR